MTLREKQAKFVWLVAALIFEAYGRGYTMSFGEAYRSPEEAARLAQLDKGIKRSLHTEGLAIDLKLFRDGRYLRTTDAYQPLGEWWEAQSTDQYQCCWGGRFGDGNHFSIAHGGRK